MGQIAALTGQAFSGKKCDWECSVCATSWPWTPLWNMNALTPKDPARVVFHQAPFMVRVGRNLFPVCSPDCARHAYLVKGLEAITDRILGTAPPPGNPAQPGGFWRPPPPGKGSSPQNREEF